MLDLQTRLKMYAEAIKVFEERKFGGFCNALHTACMRYMKWSEVPEIYGEWHGYPLLTVEFPELEPYRPTHVISGYWFYGDDAIQVRIDILKKILTEHNYSLI